MTSSAEQRRPTAILSGEVVGSDPQTAWRDELGPIFAEHHGRILDGSDGEFLAEFATAAAAVACAREIQAASRVGFRIGVHSGERPASVASRLRALAAPRAICISEAVRAQLDKEAELRFQDLGAQALEQAPAPVRAYLVRGAAPATRQPEFRRLVILVLAALVAPGIIGLAWVAYFTQAWRTGASVGAPLASVAVLPFDDLGPDADPARLADGIAEELIETLSRVDALRVVTRPSAEIARKDGIGSVVEGSVRRSGDQVRITARLIRAADASEIWSASYDRKPDDAANVRQEIAREIAAAIRAGGAAKAD
jgi:TolB-like protein